MITTILQGRAGNQFMQIAHMLAYCKKHNLSCHIPDTAYHCDGRKMYFPHLINGPELQGLPEYHELTTHATPKGDGTYNYNTPSYQDIPLIDNVKFVGYWQSFQYFDWCREYVLEKFQLLYLRTRLVSLHIRRGDFLQLTDKHPPLPLSYYYNAIEHFQRIGYNDFLIFSDDIVWCKENLISASANIMFQEEQTELMDLMCMSGCEHNIICYSTFGFIGAWLNKNPDKQVLVPLRSYCFSGANADFIPPYFKELQF